MAHEMNAGRELDALIAEKVMGLAGVRDGKSWLYGDNWTYHKKGVLCLVPHYSTQIADAWQVAEKMWPLVQGGGYGTYRVLLNRRDGDNKYVCEFAIDPDGGWSTHARAEAPTAPLAICLAALKAVGNG